MQHPLSYKLTIETFVDKLRNLAINYNRSYKNIFTGWLKRKSIKREVLKIVALASVHGFTPGQLWIESEGAFANMDFRPEEIGIK